LRFLLQEFIYLSPILVLKLHSSSNFIITGGAGFIGSNLHFGVAGKFPEARLTV